MSQIDAPQPAATQPVEPKKASPIRLMVLLVVLAIVLTGFLVDMFVMYDSVKAAAMRLQAAADATAERPRDKGKNDWLSREEVANAIGFQPTSSTVDADGRLVEYYRWWGSLPLQRRFIMVEYVDGEGKIYNSYQISNRNIYGQDEDEEALKVEQSPSEEGSTPATPMPPTPGTGPMPPAGKSSEGSDESTPAKDESASTPSETPAELPANEDK